MDVDRTVLSVPPRDLVKTLPQKIAQYLSDSSLLKTGKELWTKNERDYFLAMSKWEKLAAGMLIILSDYAVGEFPPRFEDQAKAYAAEKGYLFNLPGLRPCRLKRTCESHSGLGIGTPITCRTS